VSGLVTFSAIGPIVEQEWVDSEHRVIFQLSAQKLQHRYPP